MDRKSKRPYSLTEFMRRLLLIAIPIVIINIIAAILLHQRIHSSIDMNSMGHINTLPKNSNTKLLIYYRRKGTGLSQGYAGGHAHGDGSSRPAAPGI